MPWSTLQKIGFRFLACYVFLYTMSNQFIASPLFEKVWQVVVPAFAENVLGMEEREWIFTNGSGDTTYNYLSILVYVIVSLVVTLIWSVLDRNRLNYNTAMEWLVVLIRYYIILQMVNYGLAKLFYMQFQPARFSRLIQPYGDSSPMGLLWTFMGQSKEYTMFTGFGELLGGILLLFRRTRTIGALLTFGVMANVMALNFFYDVPVKLLSSHLVFFCLIIILLDFKRLLNVFILNKPTESISLPPHFSDPTMQKIKEVIKWVLVVGGMGLAVFQMINMMKVWGPEAPKPPLYGLYEVESFVKNRDTVPPLMTDSLRWRRLVIEWKGRATVYGMNDKRYRYDFVPDSTETFVEISSDTTSIDTLYISRPDSTYLKLEGVFKMDTLEILMKSKKKDEFLLNSRGFNWINEYPFNR